MRSPRVIGLAAMLLLAAVPLHAAPADTPPTDEVAQVTAPAAVPDVVTLDAVEVPTVQVVACEARAVDVGATIAADSVALALERADSVTALPALQRQTASARSSRQSRPAFQQDTAAYRVLLHRYSASHRPRDTSAYLTRSRT